MTWKEKLQLNIHENTLLQSEWDELHPRKRALGLIDLITALL